MRETVIDPAYVLDLRKTRCDRGVSDSAAQCWRLQLQWQLPALEEGGGLRREHDVLSGASMCALALGNE